MTVTISEKRKKQAKTKPLQRYQAGFLRRRRDGTKTAFLIEPNGDKFTSEEFTFLSDVALAIMANAKYPRLFKSMQRPVMQMVDDAVLKDNLVKKIAA